jgi:hypothetical protein
VRLPPLLGEPFGGCAGLVDVGGRKASDRASHTEVDPSLALSNTAVTTNQTPVLTHHSKHNPTAEVADLLKLEVQFLVGPEPIVKEAAYRRSTLDEFGTPVQDHIFGDVAHHPVEITAIQSLNLLAHKLNRVRRGGLLGHLPASIPNGQTEGNHRRAEVGPTAKTAEPSEKTGATGLEPAASGSTGRRSSRLSYAPGRKNGPRRPALDNPTGVRIVSWTRIDG